MRRRLIYCALVLTAALTLVHVSAQTRPNDSNANRDTKSASPIPFVEGVDYTEAPAGAVVQLRVGGYSFPQYATPPFRLQICGVTTTYTVLSSHLVAAVIPRVNSPIAPQGKPFAGDIIFFSGENGGPTYPFTVIPPSTQKGAQVEIDGIWRQKAGDYYDDYYDISFNDKIPSDLWGKVVITFDNKPVETIVKMSPQLFTIALPPGLPYHISYKVKAKVGENESSDFSFLPSGLSATPTPMPTPTPVTEEGWKLSNIVVVVSTLLTLFGLAAAAYFYLRSRLLQDAFRRMIKARTPAEELHLPDEPPAELVEACLAGECVLYAGAGLSNSSGLPVWREFVHGLLEWAHKQGYINESEEASFHSEVETGQSDPVADTVVSRLRTDEDKARLNSYLREVFLKRSSPSAFHTLLQQIKFSAILTTNLDDLMERAYEARPDQVFTPRDTEALLACLTRRDFFLLKLHGSLTLPETVILTPAQYEDEITGNRMFSQFMQTLFFSRTLLFVGASLEGIEAYLRGIYLPRGAGRRHYALVGVTDNAWRAKADLLERRYGIKVLPFTPGENYEELREFLRKLSEAVASGAGRVNAGSYTTSRLKRLSLRDIGPFTSLDLDFDSEWQIFLGDNGVGKSTVLKAIALALCGDKAEPFAWRMIKADRPSGEITLETDNKTSYVTTIKRGSNPGEAELLSTTARPLEAEGWLAIGFPPLRTTSWEPPKGPDSEIKIKSRPVAEDLLPLVRGDVDPRLDKLKQWVVNLNHLGIQELVDSKDPAGAKVRAEHYQKLIRTVFERIGAVTEGMKLNYVGVEKGTNRIIMTDDGVDIPLEALSQGTLSLIGWVGILMQRLYEVFHQDEDPTKRYALVLMDEIDAHMHPAWQRTLVNHLKDIFQNAQFIATTHSPLVVGGMPARQVARFVKGKDGKILIPPITPDMTLGYADQILTSPLFGLPTTLDDTTTDRHMERFYELDKMQNRTASQEEEYERLRRELIVRVPPQSATYDEKRQGQFAELEMLKDLSERLREASPDGAKVLLERAENMRQHLEGDNSSDKS